MIFSLFLLLLPAALLINLGLIALYGDEGIRTLVALEMDISGNYLTPTLFGEYYYNKPPLYNWILLLLFKLTGRNDEFIARIPTVLFLTAYAATVWMVLRKHLWEQADKEALRHLPALAALSLLTCGRILFWDSMLALIDICFSWLMYALCMVIYQQGEQNRYRQLFLSAYLLAAAGFMLKGLPALACLAIALATYFTWQKKWKQLFSAAHLAGAGVFIFLTGGYYALYARQNGLEEIWPTLFRESAKRTLVEHGAAETLLHFLYFPFEFLYHFLPWSVLAVFFFIKKSRRLLWKDKFMTWHLLIFLTAILPYWTSVDVHPRYLFMHVPLFFVPFLYLYLKSRNDNGTAASRIEVLFLAASLAALAAALLSPFWKAVQGLPFLLLKVAAISVLLAWLCYLQWRWKDYRLLLFALVLLTARVGFNWLVLPTRLKVECSTKVRASTLALADKFRQKPVFIYKSSLGFQPVTGYYFTRETNEILRRKHGDFEKEDLCIKDFSTFSGKGNTVLDSVIVQWECRKLYLVKCRN